MLDELYRPPLALLTDLYQLTMAYGYWKLGRAEQEAVFHLFFRKPPFAGGYAVAAGLETAIEFLRSFRFDESDIAYLATLTGNDGRPLFDAEFLGLPRRAAARCRCRRHARGYRRIRPGAAGARAGTDSPVPTAGNAAVEHHQFPDAHRHQGGPHLRRRRARPVLGVRPAACPRDRRRAVGQPRRLHRRLSATSNVLAGKLFGIPVKGTHAHSWVMSFDTEAESFEQYAAVDAQQLRLPGRHLRHARRRASGGRGRQEASPAGARDGRHSPRLGRPGLPEHRSPQDPRRSRLPRRGHRRLERSRRAHHREACKPKAHRSPSGASAPSWSPPTTSRPWAASTSSAHSETPTDIGSPRSNFPSRRSRHRFLACCRCDATKADDGLLGDMIYDEIRGIDPRGIDRRRERPDASQETRGPVARKRTYWFPPCAVAT